MALVVCAFASACSDDDDSASGQTTDQTSTDQTSGDQDDTTEDVALDLDATIQTIGAAPPPGSWDPANTLNPSQDTQYFAFVYDNLLRLSEDGTELEPHLATAWEYDTTRTVLTLTLRDDVLFSDGSPFDAAAAKLNLDRVRTGTGGASSLLAGIDSIEAPSPTELVITQTGPNAKLLFAFASTAAAMASPLAIADPQALAQQPVGSGPYRLESADQTAATFVRRDDYWNTDRQYAARHVVSGATDATARMNAVLTGTADVAEISQAAPSPEIRARVEDGTLQISTLPASASVLGINNTVAPFDDPRVALAINHAIDRETFNEVIFDGLCEPISSIFLEGQAGYVEDLEYEYDPERARQLLDEAGIGDLTIKFQSIAGAPTAPVELLQSMLAEVGITLDVTLSPIQEVFPNFFSGEFGMSQLAIFQAMPDSSYTTDFITGPRNPGTKDPALVALAEEANALAPDDPARVAVYEDINRFVFDNPHLVPLCRFPHTMVAQPNVVGIDTIHDNMGGRYAGVGVTAG